jgi:hypothetical protein
MQHMSNKGGDDCLIMYGKESLTAQEDGIVAAD